MFFKRIGSLFSLFFHMSRVIFQLLYGYWRISKLEQPIVSIFGSARITEDQIYFQQAHDFTHHLIDNDISVLAGGGPGIMDAVSCGAAINDHPVGKARSVGIGVRGLGEKKSSCMQEYFELDYFFARKWLLTEYSAAFIVFPGGFGTLDELAEVLTLIQTKKLQQAPVILIGKEFWAPFEQWVRHEALKHKTISEKDIELFIVTDDLEKAFCVVRDHCKTL